MSEHSEELEELSGELLSGNRKGEDEKELQRFRPQPAECSCSVFHQNRVTGFPRPTNDSRPPAVKFAPANRSQHRVNHAIEKEGEDGHAVMTANRDAHVAAETVRAQR
jgi:hypothetical protein